jgi:hypothetical protein
MARTWPLPALEIPWQCSSSPVVGAWGKAQKASHLLVLINPARNPSIFRRRFPIRLWYPNQQTYSDRTRSQGASSDPGEGSLERRLNGRQLYVWHTVDIRRGPWTSRRDRKNGVGGYRATQILPFADAASFTGYMEMIRSRMGGRRSTRSQRAKVLHISPLSPVTGFANSFESPPLRHSGGRSLRSFAHNLSTVLRSHGPHRQGTKGAGPRP